MKTKLPKYLQTAVVKYRKDETGTGWLIYDDVECTWRSLAWMHMTLGGSVGSVIYRIKNGMSYHEIMTTPMNAEAPVRETLNPYDPTDIASDEEAMRGTTFAQKMMMAEWERVEMESERKCRMLRRG